MILASGAGAIMAGGEFDLPPDRPSARIDPMGMDSPYNFVAALEIVSATSRYLGTATVLSRNWALSAGHNVDFNDDGQVDAGISVSLHLPGSSVFEASAIIMHPLFSGFANSIHHDLTLIHFADPLPEDLSFPVLGLPLGIGDEMTLAGFGRSGYGNYGYTTTAGLDDRRLGGNTVARLEFEQAGTGRLYRYDFSPPDTYGYPGGSLGNDWETIIGPGDSGGPALVPWMNGYALVGVNTFTEGYGGRFGDIGGGIVLEPYWDWIGGTTGLHIIPEPSALLLLVIGCLVLKLSRTLQDWSRNGRMRR